MRQSTALELRARTTGNSAAAPLVVVLTRRRAPESDAAVRACDHAAESFGIDAVALDVDATDNLAFVDELQVRFAPEVLLFSRGVVLDRAAGMRDAEDAFAWIASTLRKPA